MSVKSRDSNINLHSLIIKLIKAGKTVLKKDYGFDEVFNIFDEIDNNRYELYKYITWTSNMINRKNVRDCCWRGEIKSSKKPKKKKNITHLPVSQYH